VTDLSFAVIDVVPESYAVVPNLQVRLRIDETTGAVVHAIALRCQVRIEPKRRRYSDEESAALHDLFGDRARWMETLKPFPWIQTAAMVQGFTARTEVDLVLPCTYDLEVTGTTYMHALRDGEVPLLLLFSGTVFTRGTSGFGVEQIAWDKEARYGMPVQVWRELMDQHFPGGGWLRLDRDNLDGLTRFKAERGLASWDATISALLAEAGQVAR